MAKAEVRSASDDGLRNFETRSKTTPELLNQRHANMIQPRVRSSRCPQQRWSFDLTLWQQDISKHLN
ncbi:hypothetical protein TNCV_2922611 [Trichonephila clavipes]|nr:hypothetical protein TNCV_2922611 [Trichonephila clavipes]